VTDPPPDQPLSRAEGLAVAGLVAAGLIASGLVRVYDVHSGAVTVALTAVSVTVAFLLFWIGLGLLRVAPGRRIAAALWAVVPFNTFLLSQLAYLGFFFIPLEILAAAIILHLRARPLPRWPSFLLAAAVRLAAQAGVYAVRPVFQDFWGWR
jgi:stage V sporulation protein SpoVS